MNDLVAAFNEYFEVVSANTPQLLEEVFRLRYQALCVERQFPDFEAANFPEELETDEHDKRAIHCLLRHKPSNNYVGALRLILADPLDFKKPFPLEECTKIDPELIDVAKLPRPYLAEISRVIILNKFPQFKDSDRNSGRSRYNFKLEVKSSGIKPHRRFPHPIVGLMVALIRMCVEHDVIYWYAVMDPALNRLISLYGLHFEPIGPLTEHHGLRRPYFVDLSKVLDRMYRKHRMVWELLTDYGRLWPPALERRTEARHNNADAVVVIDAQSLPVEIV